MPSVPAARRVPCQAPPIVFSMLSAGSSEGSLALANLFIFAAVSADLEVKSPDTEQRATSCAFSEKKKKRIMLRITERISDHKTAANNGIESGVNEA